MLHDTFYVVAHFHYVLRIGAVFGILTGVFYWGPLIRGVKRIRSRRYTGFTYLFIGVNITFFPMHISGVHGLPRRCCDYPDIYSIFISPSTIGFFFTYGGMV